MLPLTLHAYTVVKGHRISFFQPPHVKATSPDFNITATLFPIVTSKVQFELLNYLTYYPHFLGVNSIAFEELLASCFMTFK